MLSKNEHYLKNIFGLDLNGNIVVPPTFYREEYLTIPDKNEQEAIANTLEDIDKEIESLSQKLSKTRQFKQGMMQQLLTGKIRLV